MSYEAGALKYLIGMLLTPVGYVSLYIFGDGIWNTIQHFQAVVKLLLYLDEPDRLIAGLFKIYLPTPEGVLESLIVYPIVGGIVAMMLWYLAMNRR